jgi:ABC-2 type transport system ATP-binding protein
MTTAIKVAALHKSFGTQRVLDGVNFTVEKGAIFALLGLNGAGKTTVIKILSTVLLADRGLVEICGFDAFKQPQKIRQVISLTGQFAAIDDVLTGRENLILIAKLRHVNNAQLAADRLLDRFGLMDAGNKRAGVYSGGMKRRLDIAMSMLGAPQVVFLDEPTTGLDPEGRLEVWKIVKELSQSGVTVFLTTQYLDEAENLADQIAILHNGTIIVNGTLSELKKLFPPAKKEYIEKQPTLEDIFLTIVAGTKDSLDD